MFTRRGMFGSMAGAAAALTAGAGAAHATTHESSPTTHPIPEDLLAAIREHAARERPLPYPDAQTMRASVVLCRSWDRQIFLYASREVRGFAVVDDRSFALAAGAQAAGRTIAAQYWGYEPLWAGVGSFAGVLLAVDERDLPPLG